MTQSDDETRRYILISRRAILEAFIKRMATQANIEKICHKTHTDFMVVPVDRFEDWFHDMGVVLGKSIQDVIDPD